MLSLWKLIFWFFLVPLISFKSVFEARLVKEAHSDAFCLFVPASLSLTGAEEIQQARGKHEDVGL